MRTLQTLLLHLDESARFIKDGRIAQLRLALLLLDNAAELRMYGWATAALAHDRMRKQIIDNARRWGGPEDIFSDIAREPFLSSNEENRVLRLFDDLTSYVAKKARLSTAHATTLRHLHRYRTDAYHRNAVRTATIRTAVLLLFQIVVELVLSDPDMLIWSSDEDYSWLKDRFGLNDRDIHHPQMWLPAAVSSIRGTLPVDTPPPAGALAMHLDARVDDLLDGLDFIRENLAGDISREAALDRAADHLRKVSERDVRVRTRMPRGGARNLSLSAVEEVNALRVAVLAAAHELDAFQLFAKAEETLEPLEFAVSELAGAIDAGIQLQTDMARGK